MKNNLLSIAVLLLLLLLFCGCEQPETIVANGKKIKIGIIGPFSGTFAAQGTNGFEGMQAAQKIQPLLDNGTALEFLIEDDQDEPSRTIAALMKLAETEKVAAVLVFSDSASVLALEAFADRYKTPIMVVLATHPEISKKSKYVTQFCVDDIIQGSVAALFVRDELLIERVAIVVNPDNPYSVRLTTEFRQRFEATGGRVTEIINISDEVDDLSAIMESLRLKHTQLLYMPIKAECLFNILKANREIKWHPKVMSGDGLLASAMKMFHDDLNLLNGLMATEFFGDNIADTDYERRLRKSYASLFSHPPTTYSALGAEAYDLLCDILNRCGEPDNRQEINEKIRQTTDFEGISGKISITAEGKAKRLLFVDKIENGRLKEIVKVY